MAVVTPIVLPGRRNLSQIVVDELMRRIDEGQFPVGGRAPTERELMEMFQVGRSTAREAVGVLVAGGVLDVRPGRGPVVLRTSDETQRPLDPRRLSGLLADQSLAHLYEFRLLIETECAANAALQADARETRVLAQLVRRFREAVRNDESTHELDMEFHLAVARASHNEVFLAVLQAVNERLSEARAMTDAVPGAREVAVLGHTEIYEAIHRHAPDAARSTMQRHILAGLAALEDANGIDARWPGRPGED